MEQTTTSSPGQGASKDEKNASILSLTSGHTSNTSFGANQTTTRRRKSNPASVPPTASLPRHHWCKHWFTSGSAAPKSSTFTQSGRAVWAGRILFVFVLIFLAVAFGVLAYYILTEDEANLAETQFRYISERALVEAKDALLARRWAGVTLANFVGELYPNADQWPYVEWLGFEQVVRSMLNTSHGNDMGFVPFVTPEELPEFEDFAQKTYRKLGFPNSTGVSKEFGFGVYARNKTVNPPVKYHDTSADTPFESPYKILAPIFRTDEGVHPVLLFNPHSQPFTGQAIDSMISCSHQRRDKYQASLDAELQAQQNGTGALPTMPPDQCGVITDIFHNVKLGGRWSVANFLPIYPILSPLTVVGYIPSIFIVDELLDNVFAKDISGIDAVFESDARSVSYHIVNGVAEYVGEGQHFDRKYINQQQVIQLIDPMLYTDGGAPPSEKSFKFYLTPNDEFYEVYQTKNPMVASIAVVLSILLTILVFLLYDFFVRKEFHAKRELLEARRQFMRFVSHEVRTPLNAVSMGLDLMQSEVANALGYASATCLRASQELDQQHLLGDDPLGRMEEGGSQPTLIDPQTQTKPTGSVVCNIPPNKAREWFQLTQEIQGNAQGAVDILNDLLNYDKIEQGTLKLGLEVLSVWHLLETVILEFKLPASSKQVELSLSFGQEGEEQTPVWRARDLPQDILCLQVIGDSVRLTQVLRNLMSNALKFTNSKGSVRVEALYVPPLTPKNGSEQTISLQKGDVASGTKAGHIKVLVTDTGAGMTPDQLAKLFQDGVQFNVNQLQKGGGSGLGLYIAKGLVKQHDGRLSATSDGIGRGASFELVLPLWKLESDDPDEKFFVDESGLAATSSTTSGASVKDELNLKETSAPEPKPLSRSTSLQFTHSLKILVVDDVKSNRKLLMRLLVNKGHSCDEAENGQECLDKVSAAHASGSPFDSILLDYEMPVMDGPTAAKEIRQLGIDVNIVGITGNVLPDDVKHFKACGANDVLAKPVKIPQLYASWLDFFSSSLPGENQEEPVGYDFEA